MVGWSDSTRRNVSIVVASTAAAPVGVGAVYFTDRVLPHQVTGVKKAIATHVILPHLEKFEKLAKGLRKAHETHDREKLEMLKEEGAPVPTPGKPQTREERAFGIADVLVDTSVALAADLGATYGFQKLLNRGVMHTHESKNTMVDGVATIGSIIAMPTVFARSSETLHHDVLRKGLYKKMGFSPEEADRLAVATTYVTVPSFIGMGAALGANHVLTMRGGR